jgi:hypothetical protein
MPSSDHDAYDRMVDDHIAPSCFDDFEDYGKTPASARREYLANLGSPSGASSSPRARVSAGEPETNQRGEADTPRPA